MWKILSTSAKREGQPFVVERKLSDLTESTLQTQYMACRWLVLGHFESLERVQ